MTIIHYFPAQFDSFIIRGLEDIDKADDLYVKKVVLSRHLQWALLQIRGNICRFKYFSIRAEKLHPSGFQKHFNNQLRKVEILSTVSNFFSKFIKNP